MLSTLSVLSMDQGKICKTAACMADCSDEDVLEAARQTGGSWVSALFGRAYAGLDGTFFATDRWVRR